MQARGWWGPEGWRGYIKTRMVAVASLFCHPTKITMNKTVIQYRNKTISHYHDHAHDHVPLHGLGDLASLLIAVIVMVGIITAMIAVACLVSNKKAISLGGREVRGGWSLCSTLTVKRVHLVFHFRCGHGSTATCNRPPGSGSRTVPLRWRGSDKHIRGGSLEVQGYDSYLTSTDIYHGLGYNNNSGLPVTRTLTWTLHEWITTKNCLNRFTHTKLIHNYLSLLLHNTFVDLRRNV